MAIIAIVSKLNSRIINGNASQSGLDVEVIFFGTTVQDNQTIGENNNAIVSVDLSGVSTLVGLRNAIAAACRANATQSGFTVAANNVLVPTYQAA